MRLLPIVALALLVPSAASAQSPSPIGAHTQAVTANPFLTVVGWFNAEYERRLSPTTTWGLSGSLAELDDFRYRSGKLLLRYYPQEDALSGLFLGGRTGVYHVVDRVGGGLTGSDDSEAFFAVGVELGYNWLLGRERHFVISIGGGISRLFGGDLEDASQSIPTIRIVNIGVAF